MSQNYFIAIGVGQYTNGPFSLGESCKNDCGKMVDALKRFGFSPLNYKYFVDPKKPKSAPRAKDTILLDDEATLANIKSLFDGLRDQEEFDPNSLAPENNLIVYYSGHGISSVKFKKSNCFNWVPVDYPFTLDQPADDRYLYSWANQLMSNLGNIRFQNLILINDSCFSGAGLTIQNVVAQDKTVDDTAPERSVWALCSCAANDLSYADEDTESSLFTTRLCELLLNRKEDDFAVSTLCDEMILAKDIPSQRFFCERLDVIPNNTGNYQFSLVEIEKEKKALAELADVLKDGLPKYMNYEKEKRILRNLNEKADAVLIFSNHKDSGLPLMIRSANELLRAFEKKLEIIHESTINHAKDKIEKLFCFFNLTMTITGPVDSEAELIKKISAKLKIQDYFIGIILNEDTRKNKNLQFVTDLVNIVNASHNVRKSGKHIYLFILDELLTDYSGLPLKNDTVVESKLVTDKIVINSDNFDKWYVDHANAISSNYYREKYIKSYLKAEVYDKMKGIFKDEKTPAFAISEICKKAKCAELANILLTQFKD